MPAEELRRVRRPDQEALPEVPAQEAVEAPVAEPVAEAEAPAVQEVHPSELDPEASEPEPAAVNAPAPYSRNGLAVVDANGVIFCVAGAIHHSAAQRIGIANKIVEALNA